MSWIEQKYINAVSPRLQFFTKKADGVWNLRCPICGDSRKSKTKARGFILEKGSKYTYVCHNCNISMSFGRFLETVDPQLYHEYRRETFLESKGSNSRYDKVPQPKSDISKFVQPKFVKYTVLNNLQKVSQLRPDHPVKRYVLSRQIPSKYHFKLFLAMKFKEWTNTLIPNKFNLDNGDEPRLIIPLVDNNGNLFGYQGRSFGKTEPRYITIILDSTKPKVYGAESLDINRTVYVVEGPIDSMFLDNSIAMIGSHLDKSVVDLGLKRDNVVVVYDNEPRNPQIMKQVERAIENGYRVCIWPSDIQEKDINEMVRAGRTPQEVERIIDTHTYKDLMARAMLIKWKKV